MAVTGQGGEDSDTWHKEQLSQTQDCNKLSRRQGSIQCRSRGVWTLCACFKGSCESGRAETGQRDSRMVGGLIRKLDKETRQTDSKALRAVKGRDGLSKRV